MRGASAPDRHTPGCTGNGRMMLGTSIRRRIAAAALALSFVGGRAEASPSARLVYSRSESAASCPSENELRSAVAARFGYDPFFLYAPQTVVVQVARGHDEFRARVELVDAQGMARGTRELSSARATCGELFEAMALAISIALDASAVVQDTTPEAEPAPIAPVPSSAPSTGAPSTGAPAPPPTALAPAAGPANPAPARPHEEPPARAPRANARSPVTFFAGADLRGSLGLAPSLAAGVGLFVGARYRSVSLALEGFADAPASSAPKDGVGRAESWLVAGAIAPCVHVAFAFACGLVEIGAIEARGLDVTQPETPSAPFVALGARLGAELPLSPVWAFRVGGDLLVDLNRPSLRIDGTEMWKFTVLAGGIAMGLAARFR
jgi:hypothetical protein